jgi:phenylpropionate dioxygenase-like ring-hydroxylating dioxygenase large terminal subunit
VVRSFHNVCRHRASRLADGSHGNCGHRIVCPYHAWSYHLDGRLANVPPWQGFNGLDEASTACGRSSRRSGWASSSSASSRAAERGGDDGARRRRDRAARLPDLQPQGRVTLRPRPVNWKNIGDNYSDSLHIPVAHPGLTRLFGTSYGIEAKPWVDRMWGDITETPSSNWVERTYQSLLPAFDHLDGRPQRRWSYYRSGRTSPSTSIPDQVDFMQFVPISATQTLIREIAYVRPGRAARGQGPPATSTGASTGRSTPRTRC